MDNIGNVVETMDRDELEQFQIEKIQALINRLYMNIPYYRDIMNKGNIKPSDIKKSADINRLPFTDKEVLLLNQPYGLYALPLREIVRFHSTSGTTGKPIAVGYSRNDINHWSELIFRNLKELGVTDHDVVQIAFEYGMFTGGLGFHYGAEKIGASIIPISNSNPEHQIQIMRDYKTTVFISTPTMACNVVNAIMKSDINKNELSLKTGIFGSEPWSEETRNFIENGLNIKAYDCYGLSEIIGPGVAFECKHRNGLHLNEDHFYAEIINPATYEILGDDEEGELVLTTLTKEAFPLLRYRTRDITSITRSKCGCGRTTLRLGRMEKRTDDVMIVGGEKIYPQAISGIIAEIEEVGDKFEMNITRENGKDRLFVMVEIRSGDVIDIYSNLVKIADLLKLKIKEIYNVDVAVKLVESATLSHIKKNYKITDMR
jgi:phenylacetate-CoA ligase